MEVGKASMGKITALLTQRKPVVVPAVYEWIEKPRFFPTFHTAKSMKLLSFLVELCGSLRNLGLLSAFSRADFFKRLWMDRTFFR